MANQYCSGVCGQCQKSIEIQILLDCKHQFCADCFNDCCSNGWVCPTCQNICKIAMEVRTSTFEIDPQTADHDDDQCCQICYGSQLTQSFLTCGHNLCLDCAIQWMQIKSECPFCRQHVNQA